ncbi:MAG: hypothetical protein ACI9E5_001128, partial [Candidatus Omnitrophota bacterium]
MNYTLRKIWTLTMISLLSVIVSTGSAYAADIEAVLDSTDGSSALSIQDSSQREIMDVTSDGALTLHGTNVSGS